jgi:hypothetical protein
MTNGPRLLSHGWVRVRAPWGSRQEFFCNWTSVVIVFIYVIIFVRSSYGNYYEYYCFLECRSVVSDRCLLTFWRNMSPVSEFCISSVPLKQVLCGHSFLTCMCPDFPLLPIGSSEPFFLCKMALSQVSDSFIHLCTPVGSLRAPLLVNSYLYICITSSNA